MLLGEKHENGDLATRAKTHRHDNSLAERERPTWLDMSEPVTFVVILHLQKLVRTARKLVSPVVSAQALNRRRVNVAIDLAI